MQRRWIVAAAALLALVLATGCSKHTTSPSPAPGGGGGTDQAQVASTISASGTLIDDGMVADNAMINDVDTTGTGTFRLTWHAVVSRDSSTWNYAFSDSDSTGHFRNCLATLSRHVVGTIVIQRQTIPGDTTHLDTTAINRPFDKTLTRKVMLQRMAIGGQRVWKVVQVSGAREDFLAATAHIMNVRLLGAGVDTTITDPLQLMGLRQITIFNPGDSVTVMVTPLNSTDAIFVRGTGITGQRLTRHGSDQHFRFPTSVTMTGWRSLLITDIAAASLTDTTATTRFDANAWHLLFRIRGGQPDVDFWPQ